MYSNGHAGARTSSISREETGSPIGHVPVDHEEINQSKESVVAEKRHSVDNLTEESVSSPKSEHRQSVHEEDVGDIVVSQQSVDILVPSESLEIVRQIDLESPVSDEVEKGDLIPQESVKDFGADVGVTSAPLSPVAKESTIEDSVATSVREEPKGDANCARKSLEDSSEPQTFSLRDDIVVHEETREEPVREEVVDEEEVSRKKRDILGSREEEMFAPTADETPQSSNAIQELPHDSNEEKRTSDQEVHEKRKSVVSPLSSPVKAVAPKISSPTKITSKPSSVTSSPVKTTSKPSSVTSSPVKTSKPSSGSTSPVKKTAPTTLPVTKVTVAKKSMTTTASSTASSAATKAVPRVANRPVSASQASVSNTTTAPKTTTAATRSRPSTTVPAAASKTTAATRSKSTAPPAAVTSTAAARSTSTTRAATTTSSRLRATSAAPKVGNAVAKKAESPTKPPTSPTKTTAPVVKKTVSGVSSRLYPGPKPKPEGSTAAAAPKVAPSSTTAITPRTGPPRSTTTGSLVSKTTSKSTTLRGKTTTSSTLGRDTTLRSGPTPPACNIEMKNAHGVSSIFGTIVTSSMPVVRRSPAVTPNGAMSPAPPSLADV